MDSTIYASRLGRTPSQQVQSVWDDFNRPRQNQTTVPQGLKDLIAGQRASDQTRFQNIQNDMTGTGQITQPVADRLSDAASNLYQDQQTITNPAYDIPQDVPQNPANAAQTPVTPIQLPTQAATVDPQSFQMDKKPADATNGQKVFDPNSVKAGSAVISHGMENNLPPAQSSVQAQTQVADHNKLQQDLQAIAGAKNPKTAWKEVQKDPFYKNSDFYTGLMNTGLAIMSGANPMEAFQAGKGAMDRATLSTQIGGNKQALIDQGYSPASIEAAITSGDTSKLKMQEMSDQDRMQSQSDMWTKQQRYNQDLNAQKTAQDNSEWDRRNAIGQQNTLAQQAASDKRMQQRSDLAMQRSKDLIDYRGQAKINAAKAEANSLLFGPKDVNSEAKNPDYTNIKTWSVKNEFFNAADKDLKQTTDAIQSKDGSRARSGYMQAVINAARGEIGDGSRSLQIDDLSHFAEDPSIFVKKGGEWALKAGLTPTDGQMEYLKNQIDIGGNTARQGVVDLKKRRIDSLEKTYGLKKATAFVNKVYGGEWYDPYNTFNTELSDSDRQGALSSANTAGLNNFE